MSNDHMNLFVEEARENIDSLIAGLLRLEAEDASSAEHTINELFRFAHNVKGMAATVGLDAITGIAHYTEDLLEGNRRSGLKPDSASIDLFLRAADALAEMVEVVATGDRPASNDEILAQLEHHLDRDRPVDSSHGASHDPLQPAGTTSDSQAPAAGSGTISLAVQLVDGCALPGARAAVVLRSINARATIQSTHPSETDITSGKLTEFSVDVPATTDVANLISAVLDLTDVAAAGVIESVPARVAADEQSPEPLPAPGDATNPTRPVASRSTVRVEVERLDDLMNLVGELVIGRGQLEGHVRRIADGGLNDSAVLLTRTISDIYAAVARARMISLEGTFDRLNRLVRDTARELHKDVDFHMEGADTELDRSMIDEVARPLVHLLRNALDHGIEAPGHRDTDKPTVGQVSLTARCEGNQVLIEVADDGRGIDETHVVAKAVERGLISPQEVESLTAEQRVRLVFHPGLSTRDSASTISGRGVGLDVVESSVARLGGSVDVESTPGAGSAFTIRLPLSLAVLETLLISVAGQTWAVPLVDIDETIVVTESDLNTVLGSPVVNLRGHTVPLIHGRRALALQDPPEPPFPAVVFRTRGERRALSVDELLEQSEVVVKPAPDILRSVAHVSGVTILNDGTVGLIVDVDNVAEQIPTHHPTTERREHVVSA